MWKESQTCGRFNKYMGPVQGVICTLRKAQMHSTCLSNVSPVTAFEIFPVFEGSHVCLSFIVPCHHTCYLLYTPSHTLSSTSDEEENKIFPVQDGNLGVLVIDRFLVRFQPCLSKLFPVQYCSFLTHVIISSKTFLSICTFISVLQSHSSLSQTKTCVNTFLLVFFFTSSTAHLLDFSRYLQIVRNRWTFLSISRLCTTAGPFSLSPDCAQPLDLSLYLQIVHNCWTFLSVSKLISIFHSHGTRHFSLTDQNLRQSFPLDLHLQHCS